MNRKSFAILTIVLGAAFFLGALFFTLDNLTASDPAGLGEWRRKPPSWIPH